MPYSSRCTAGAIQRRSNFAEAGVSIGCTVKGATIRLKKNMEQYNACNTTLISFLYTSQHHFVIKKMIRTSIKPFQPSSKKVSNGLLQTTINRIGLAFSCVASRKIRIGLKNPLKGNENSENEVKN